MPYIYAYILSDGISETVPECCVKVGIARRKYLYIQPDIRFCHKQPSPERSSRHCCWHSVPNRSRHQQHGFHTRAISTQRPQNLLVWLGKFSCDITQKTPTCPCCPTTSAVTTSVGPGETKKNCAHLKCRFVSLNGFWYNFGFHQKGYTWGSERASPLNGLICTGAALAVPMLNGCGLKILLQVCGYITSFVSRRRLSHFILAN